MAIDEQAVRRETILAVDRETAWAALSDPAELATWLADEVELEICEGAEGTVRWRTGEERRAVVEEVAERRRIALRWWEPDGDASLVELTLDDDPAGTRLTVLELPLSVLDVFGSSLDRGLETRWGPQMVAAVAC